MTSRSGITRVIAGAGVAAVVTLTSLMGGMAHAEEPVYVLIGTPPAQTTFDDGNVDGRDFLVWQRNPSPSSSGGVSSSDLADWQSNYGAGH